MLILGPDYYNRCTSKMSIIFVLERNWSIFDYPNVLLCIDCVVFQQIRLRFSRRVQVLLNHTVKSMGAKEKATFELALSLIKWESL